MREMDETLKSVELLIEADVERSVKDLQAQLERGEIGEIGFGEDEKAIREDAKKKVADLRDMYRIASKGDIAERVSAFSFSSFSSIFLFGFFRLVLWGFEVDADYDSCRLCLTG